MNAGAYKERVFIEKCAVETDEIGNKIPIWSEHYSGYAYVNNLSGSEYWEAAQTQSENTVVFTFGY